MSLTWYLCDLTSGGVVADLPLRPSGSVERSVSKASTLSVSLDVHSDSCPANWATLIDPLRALIVLDMDGYPLVGYTVDNDQAGNPSATFSLTSLEGVMHAVNVRTYDFYEDEHDEATVAQTLLSDVLAAPLSTLGSFGFALDVTLTGKKADHSYAFEEDRTVGSALDDLASAAGGPEWTIRLAWDDPERRQRIIKTIHVGPKIGNDLPAVIFENVHLQQRTRNTSSARGDRAVHVIATGDGSGPDRPMSPPSVDQAALAAGVPQWEARVPVSAVDEVEQLARIADAGLARRRRGLRTWEMQLALTARGCPRVGQDFDAGDTVTIDSGPTQHDPTTWYGSARVIGWRMDIESGTPVSVTPVFWQAPEEGAA